MSLNGYIHLQNIFSTRFYIFCLDLIETTNVKAKRFEMIEYTNGFVMLLVFAIWSFSLNINFGRGKWESKRRFEEQRNTIKLCIVLIETRPYCKVYNSILIFCRSKKLDFF